MVNVPCSRARGVCPEARTPETRVGANYRYQLTFFHFSPRGRPARRSQSLPLLQPWCALHWDALRARPVGGLHAAGSGTIVWRRQRRRKRNGGRFAAAQRQQLLGSLLR